MVKYSSGYNLKKNSEFKDFDKKFVQSLSIVAGIVAILGSVLNFIFNFGLTLSVVPLLGGLGYGITYYLVRYENKIEISKYLVTIISWVIVNALWFFNYGSNGPAPYFFVILCSVIVFVWHGKRLWIITGVLIVNLLVIVIIDFNFPEITSEYPNDKTRLFDTYTGVLMYIAIIFVILKYSKNSYIKEYRKAKQSDILKSAFLANMSHEIRTPLNAIVGFSDMLLSDKYSEKERIEFHNIIKENNQQLLNLISDILDVSKIEVGQLKLASSPANITELLRNLEITYQKSLREKLNKNVNLVFEYPEDEFVIETDKSRLKQVLSNLLDNAIKFTKEGYIKVTCEIREKEIFFSVKDTGIGIDEKDKKNIFTRFYKIENTIGSKVYGGTGIGLFLTSSFVELLGGEINLISKEGEGTEFYFTLPEKGFRYIEKKDKEEKSGEISEISGSINLLLAEDDKPNQFYLKTILKKIGIKPAIVENGGEAVNFMKNNKEVQVVLMDVKMPEMDGFEAIKQIRQFNSDVYIIAQTAHAMADDKENALKAGFDDYITKPINALELKKKISLAVSGK